MMNTDVDDFEDDAEDDDMRWSEPYLGCGAGGMGGLGEERRRQSGAAAIEMAKKTNVEVSSSSSASGGSIMSRIALNDNKAGMVGIDKEKINKIIMEASQGSRFYENERKKEAQMNQRVERMRQQLAGISEQQKAVTLAQIDDTVAALEASRSFHRSIVHLDMDAFYAAVEMRDNPSLKDKPMAVGGMSMLSTSNYHARRFGVRAAMPGFIGKKLCPQLIIVPTNFDKYRAVSEAVRGILAEYDPNFCPMSLDEAYFDLTDHLERRRDLSDAARTFEYGEWTEIGGRTSTQHCADKLGAQQSQIPTLGAPDSSLLNQRSPLADDYSLLPSSGRGNQSETLSQSLVRHHLVVSNLDNLEERSPSTEARVEGSVAPRSKDVVPKTTSRTFGFTVEDAVEEIRFCIEQKTQLTASAGIAPNTMLAKICSDKNKPNGQYRILPTRKAVMEFVQQLPIRKVCGIGKVTEKLLSALGIHNCTDLFQQRAVLHLLFSPISSQHFLRISLGLGSTRVERDSERKSMSTERTFHELHRPADLYSKCNELCQALAVDLQKEELTGKTVTIKLKTVKFEVKTRANSVSTRINTADCIFNVAKDLLRIEINACKPEPLRLRLMGVRLSNLQPSGAASTSKQNSITKFFKKQQPTSAPKQTEESPSHGQFTASNQTGTDEVGDDDNIISIAHGNRMLTLAPGSSDSDQMITGMGQSTAMPTGVSVAMATKWDMSTSNSEGASPSRIQSHHPFNMGVSQIHGQNRGNFTDSLNSQTDELRTPINLEGRTSMCGEIGEDLSVGERTSLELVCPICNVSQSNDLETFNEHVDVCLNMGAIQDILKQRASEEQSCSKRSSTSPTKGKRSLSGSKPASKRRKHEKTQRNTLDKFFS